MEESFTFFPRLPLELRESIWTIVALQRRDIKVFSLLQDLPDSNHGLVIPPILLVNHESRRIASKYYEPVKESSLQPRELIRLLQPNLGDSDSDASTSSSDSIDMSLKVPIPKMTKAARTIYLNFDVDNFILDKSMESIVLEHAPGPLNLNFAQDKLSKVQNCILKTKHVCSTSLFPGIIFTGALRRSSVSSCEIHLDFGWDKYACVCGRHNVCELWSIINWEQRLQRITLRTKESLEAGATYSVKFTFRHAWDPSSQFASFEIEAEDWEL